MLKLLQTLLDAARRAGQRDASRKLMNILGLSGIPPNVAGLSGLKFKIRLLHGNHLNHFWALGRRCGHPGQQQGRFLPSMMSSPNRFICSARVFSCFTIVVQQIHSLRASGVSLFHFSNSSGLVRNAFFKSSGTSCTTPSSIAMVVI